ncbi:MAG: hypothetical protein J6D30_00645 [Clostridia bacterium]|nr:hypothetical protein [Clostridia bacterium]
MRSEQFITSVLKKSAEENINCQEKLPLGEDAIGNPVFAKTYDGPTFYRHTCVTGACKGAFIRRLLITLSCLYEKDEACFLVLSPSMEYAELLKLTNIDITVPYVRTKEDFGMVKSTIEELVARRDIGVEKFPKLFIVMDGLENLPSFNESEMLDEYREIFDLVSRRENVEVITGVDLKKSIFSGSPGAFVGVGNCLVSTREEGKADVTYVGGDVTLSAPAPIVYPTEPDLADTVVFLNSIDTRN